MTIRDFNVGDRVLVMGRIDGNDLTNETGTVIYVDDCDDCNPKGEILIEFDNEIPNGHDGIKVAGRDRHCWYAGFSEGDFDVIEIINEDVAELEMSSELSTFISEFCVKEV